MSKKAKVKIEKAPNNEKDQKGSQALLRTRKGSQKEKRWPSQKEKVNGPLGHWIRVRIGIRIKEPKGESMEKERSFVRSVDNQVTKLISARGAISSSKEQDQLIQTLRPDRLRGFQDLRPFCLTLARQADSVVVDSTSITSLHPLLRK